MKVKVCSQFYSKRLENEKEMKENIYNQYEKVWLKAILCVYPYHELSIYDQIIKIKTRKREYKNLLFL